MIDRIENTIQIGVLLCCLLIALYKAVKFKSRTWTLLAFVYGSWLQGDLFWLLCLLVYGSTPQISIVSDMSWYGIYLFLYLLLRHNAPPETAVDRRPLPWLGFVFTFGMAAFFMQWGEILNNLIYAMLMGLLMYASIRRLTERPGRPSCRPLCLQILVFCLIEYALWVSSCFLQEESLLEPYYWCDLLLTLSAPFFLPAARRAVMK